MFREERRLTECLLKFDTMFSRSDAFDREKVRTSSATANAKAYQGKALQSTSLPDSPRIPAALSHINDYFVNPSPQYDYRHLEMLPAENQGTRMNLKVFDGAEDVYLGILGVLHLVARVQDSLARIVRSLFVPSDKIDVGPTSLRKNAGDWAQRIMDADLQSRWFLQSVGLRPQANPSS